MINMIFRDKNGVDYKRVNKTNARRAYNEGRAVILCPSNLRPFTMWGCEVETDNRNGYEFDKVVNIFSYYNCINNETGRGVNYFLPIAD